MYPFKVLIYDNDGYEVYGIVEYADYIEQAKKYALQDFFRDYHADQSNGVGSVYAYEL